MRPTDAPGLRPRRVVVAAAIVDDLAKPTQVLAGRRTEPSSLAGGWELPGGKVEQGESPLVALHREIDEELGVQIELGAHVPGPLPGLAWPLGDDFELLVWFAAVLEGEPQPLEDHDLLSWVPLADIEQVAWLPADLPLALELAAIARRR